MAPTKGGKLSIGQKILNATASQAGKPEVKVCRKKVAKMCGYSKAEPKVYSNALGILSNKKGHIRYDKDYITITVKGFKNAEPEAPLGSNEDALEQAKEKVNSSKQKQILDICADGNVHSVVEIAKLIGADHTKKSFGNLLGPLRSKFGLIDYVTTDGGEKAIKATEDLIPFGDESA